MERREVLMSNFRMMRRAIRSAPSRNEREIVMRSYRRIREVGFMYALAEIAIVSAIREGAFSA